MKTITFLGRALVLRLTLLLFVAFAPTSAFAQLNSCLVTGDADSPPYPTAVIEACADGANLNYRSTPSVPSTFNWILSLNTSGASIVGSSTAQSIEIDPGNIEGVFTLTCTVTSIDTQVQNSCAVSVAVYKPIITGVPAARCGPGEITLGATGLGFNSVVNWYTAANGGSPIFTGTSYTTSVNSTTSFWISDVVTTPFLLLTCEGPRVEVVATVSPNPTANAGTDDATCYNGGVNQIQLSGSASGGTAPYTYAWSGDAIAFLSAANIQNPALDNAPIGVHTFTLTVTDDNGCEDTDTVILEIYANPTANAGTDDATCYNNGVNKIQLSGSASEGTAPYTYEWTAGPISFLSDVNIANPTLDNAPVGVHTFTLTVTDANGCEDTDTVVLEIYANPICSASNNGPVCTGDAVSLSETGGDAVSWLWSSNGAATFNDATLQNPTASGAVDGEIFSVLITDSNGCTSTCTTTVTIEPCNEPLCTYTQGYYGNPGGKSCDGENTYTTYGLIQKALDSYTDDIMKIGWTGYSISISKTDADIKKVIEYMPGGKGIGELRAGNPYISNNNFKSWYTRTTGKNTKIDNKLLAQTIALGLNLGMNSDLANFELHAGTFATAKLEGGCGSTIAKERYCDNETGMVYNEYQYYTVKSNIAGVATNVSALFALANRALGNADGIVGSENGVSLNDIASAVDMINNAFDECRMPMGYGIEKLVCQTTAPTIAAKVATVEKPAVIDSSVDFKVYPVPFEDVINVQYRFEYDTDVTIQVFNLQGGLIYGAVDNFYNHGEIATKQINLARTFDQALIIRLTTSKEKLNKNIVAKSSKQR